MIPPLTAPATPNKSADRDRMLRQKAQELESAFLTQMLKSAGIEITSKEFGGGIGEQQFSSFLWEEQAKKITAQGGLGLSEAIFKSLIKGRQHDG